SPRSVPRWRWTVTTAGTRAPPWMDGRLTVKFDIQAPADRPSEPLLRALEGHPSVIHAPLSAPGGVARIRRPVARTPADLFLSDRGTFPSLSPVSAAEGLAVGRVSFIDIGGRRQEVCSWLRYADSSFPHDRGRQRG